MLVRSIAYRQLARFCSNKAPDQAVQKTKEAFLTSAQKKKDLQTPIHLRPYDKFKYEVPMKKIKKNSGYAMIQIEPFPRARIMKIAYNVLEQVRIGIPEDYMGRILIEEKFKWIMEIVDKQEDVQKIEEFFGRVPIELFTRNLADTLQIIEAWRKLKPWNSSQQEIEEQESQFIKTVTQEQEKYPQYKKGERQKVNLL